MQHLTFLFGSSSLWACASLKDGCVTLPPWAIVRRAPHLPPWGRSFSKRCNQNAPNLLPSDSDKAKNTFHVSQWNSSEQKKFTFWEEIEILNVHDGAVCGFMKEIVIALRSSGANFLFGTTSGYFVLLFQTVIKWVLLPASTLRNCHLRAHKGNLVEMWKI